MAKQLTKNQTVVLEALTRSDAPLSAYSLLDQVRSHGMRAPLQVYRALERLVELGLVHRLESINAFVACTHPEDHVHRLIAFAICTTCGRTEEISDAVIEGRLRNWSKEQSFKLEKATVEIRGTCSRCHPAGTHSHEGPTSTH
ncbi:Fur family transcriptional regulator [Mangrovicella endophytica]|uniref:Fur family transcriptional regulator n=1 Tax=Mangrovicella endophytica TaxID=2066697 RepID=UPI0024780178|nr:Fur family transcriptional regulator [Mangrovicella endophytica]